MKTIDIDLETYSGLDIKNVSTYKYAENTDAEILLFGYSIDDGDEQQIDMACGEELPQEILNALLDNNIIKWAHNAVFERIFLSAWLWRHHPDLLPHGTYLDSKAWRCSMVWAMYLGLPASLKNVGTVLHLDEQKMDEGTSLINYFCKPCKPTKANGGRTRNLPSDAPDKWATFKEYNLRDVKVEKAIRQRLVKYPVPDRVWEEYVISENINDRGICVDLPFVRNAIEMDAKTKESIMAKMRDMTGLDNPNSPIQFKGWLAENGIVTDSIDKDAIKELTKNCSPEVAEVLKLRQMLSKTSVTKYQRMVENVCDDGRLHGMFKYYGAARTGRWSGQIVQLHNLPKNSMAELNDVRKLVASGDYESLDMLYENIPDALSQLVRTAFVPQEGYKYIVADFSAIEARVLSYEAGEKWRMQVFHEGGDIYCQAAKRMYHLDVCEKNGINGEYRSKGKIAELGLGYGGSVGALLKMGALDQGLTEDELKPMVDAWRAANPRIKEFWWTVDRAIKDTLQNGTPTTVNNIGFLYKGDILFIILPSGRRLAYVKPRIEPNDFGGTSITYFNTEQGKWTRSESYGPKFVENIIQAISRDILAEAMKRLTDARIVAHVHDELIIEAPMDASVDEVCKVMGQTPAWITGLELKADGYECMYYKKD